MITNQLHLRFQLASYILLIRTEKELDIGHNLAFLYYIRGHPETPVEAHNKSLTHSPARSLAQGIIVHITSYDSTQLVISHKITSQQKSQFPSLTALIRNITPFTCKGNSIHRKPHVGPHRNPPCISTFVIHPSAEPQVRLTC